MLALLQATSRPACGRSGRGTTRMCRRVDAWTSCASWGTALTRCVLQVKSEAFNLGFQISESPTLPYPTDSAVRWRFFRESVTLLSHRWCSS